jgi:hypothetical protein
MYPVPPAGILLPTKGGEQRVEAQKVVIVHVFIAEAQSQYLLAYQFLYAVLDKSLIAVIEKTGAKISKVVFCDGNLSQEQSSRIGADGSAFEIRDNFFLARS